MLTAQEREYLQYSHIALRMYKEVLYGPGSDGYGRVCTDDLEDTKSCLKGYDLYYFLILFHDWYQGKPDKLTNPLQRFEFDAHGFFDIRGDDSIETAGLRPYKFHLGNVGTKGTYIFDSDKRIFFCINDQTVIGQKYCGGVYTSKEEYNSFFVSKKEQDDHGKLCEKINIIFQAILSGADEIRKYVLSSSNMDETNQKIILDHRLFLALSYLNPFLFRSWVRSSLCYLLEHFKEDNMTENPESRTVMQLNENHTFLAKSKRLRVVSAFYYDHHDIFELVWDKIDQLSRKIRDNQVLQYHPTMTTKYEDDCQRDATKDLVEYFYKARACHNAIEDDKNKFRTLYDLEKTMPLYRQIAKQINQH
ncbi:MAG: hypothetical protein LBM69_02925 [Lachnospiraceae bacterium]|jgi:hypothetical protein|nr:hypothetical protein [Lachnospiraceae bacterium]